MNKKEGGDEKDKVKASVLFHSLRKINLQKWLQKQRKKYYKVHSQ